MIELSSWEWFLVLLIATIIIWLLIIYQTKLTSSEVSSIQAHESETGHYETQSSDDMSGKLE
jgi:hypothetical protein